MFDCISPEWPWISSFDWYVWARRSQAMKSTAKIIQLMFNWFDIEVANLNVAQDLLISTVKSTITPMIDFLILRFSFSLCKQFLGSKMLRSLSICNLWGKIILIWNGWRKLVFKMSIAFIRRKFTRRVFFNANIDAMALLSVDAHTILMSNQNTNRSVTDFILKMTKNDKEILHFYGCLISIADEWDFTVSHAPNRNHNTVQCSM